LFKQRLNFSGKEEIENMDKLEITQRQNIAERTVEFSRKRKD